MASYHCFIQARYSSKRLRGKVLKKFGKLTLLEILVKRLSQSNQLKKIVILTSKSKDDKKIINFCKKKNINYFAGPLKNVFFRFKLAIKKYKPNRIIRISGDSPLIDWLLIDEMIALSKKHTKYDIISNVKKRTFPKGQSIEILKPEIFNLQNDLLSKYEKEHVTKYFYKKKYKVYNLEVVKKFNKYNLSVDTSKDYISISSLINKKGIYATWKNYVKEL